MHFSNAAVSAFVLSLSGAASFSTVPSAAFVSTRSASRTAPVAQSLHPAGCSCSACLGTHAASCPCASCRGRTLLFSTEPAAAAEVTEVPPEVEALDGIESADEAHNAERPARKSLKKKGPKGKPLSEFSVGETVTAKVKTLASYGAFMDIGASTDGLLHISQLSVDYVSDVNEILKAGEEYQVRILSIDEAKNQVALTLLTEAQEDAAKEAASRPRQNQRSQRDNNQNRRDDSAILSQLASKGFSPEQFVEGKVVSTVDFGAFVRIDASQLNSAVEGEFDGLVHISALTPGRCESVTSVVNVDDTVQVRVKGISNKKVSLSMISPEDEQQSASFSSGAPAQGNSEWRDTLAKMKEDMPVFTNKPQVVDLRN